MTVYQDGKLIKKIPVSLGKPSTPCSSGNMVIMEKLDRPPSTPGATRTAATWSTSTTRSGSPGAASSSTRAVVGGAAGHTSTSRTAAPTSRATAAPGCWASPRSATWSPSRAPRCKLQTGQRLDRLERQLGRVRQGQRAARPGRAEAHPWQHAAPGRGGRRLGARAGPLRQRGLIDRQERPGRPATLVAGRTGRHAAFSRGPPGPRPSRSGCPARAGRRAAARR